MKNNIIQIIIIVVFVTLLIMGYIKWADLSRFVIITGILLIYTRILKQVDYDEKKDMGGYKYKIAKHIRSKGIEKEIKVYKILLWIYKYKNPLIILIYKIEDKIFDIMRWINWKLLKYKKVRLLIYVILKNVITSPLIIVFNKYYDFIKKWKGAEWNLLILRRAISLIINVVILSSIMSAVISVLGLKYILLLIYVILVTLGVLSDIKLYSDMQLLQWFQVKIVTNTYGFKVNRVKASLIGQLASGQVFEMIQTKTEEVIKIDKKYDHWLSRPTLMKEYGVYMYWDEMKSELLNWLQCNSIMYRPSNYFYMEVSRWVNTPITDLHSIYYAYNKIEEEELKRKVKNLYEYELKRIKVLLYWIWEVEDYLGVQIKTRIEPCELNCYILINVENCIGEPGSEYYKMDRIRIYFPVGEKADEEFFDIEKNYDYYDRFCKSTQADKDVYRYFTEQSKLYKNYKKIVDKYYDSKNWGEREDEINIEVEMERVARWCRDIKRDYITRKKKKKIKERNWELLLELEKHIEKELNRNMHLI